MSRFPHQANEDAKFDPPPNQTVLLLRGRHMRWRWRWRSCGRKETRKIEESAFSTEKGKGGAGEGGPLGRTNQEWELQTQLQRPNRIFFLPKNHSPFSPTPTPAFSGSMILLRPSIVMQEGGSKERIRRSLVAGQRRRKQGFRFLGALLSRWPNYTFRVSGRKEQARTYHMTVT